MHAVGISTGVATLLLAMLSGGVVYRLPQALWLILIFASIIGCGIGIFGYFAFDEAIIYGVLIGVVLGCAIRGDLKFSFEQLSNLHTVLFLTMTLYLGYQAIAGALYMGEWRVFRYVLYFLALAVLALVMTIPATRRPANARLDVVIVVCTTLYCLAYLWQGLMFEAVVGRGGRFASQGDVWAGSAYAVFPLLLATPVALRLFARNPILVSIYFALVVLLGQYFESRAAMAVLLIFAVMGLGVNLRKWMFVFLVLVLAGLILWSVDSEQMIEIASGAYLRLKALIQGAMFLFSPRASDVDRHVHFLAAIQTVWNDPLSLLFGNGFYGHRTAMLASLEELGVPHAAPVRTTGFSTLLVDTGIIGMLLLLANVLLASVEILRRNLQENGRISISFVAAPLLILPWLAVTNILDTVLLFLMIMPRGPLVQVAELPPMHVPAFRREGVSPTPRTEGGSRKL